MRGASGSISLSRRWGGRTTTYSKGLGRLTKRYAEHQPKGWLRGRIRRNLTAWGSLVPEYFAVNFGRRRNDPLAQAVFRWKRAGAAGKMAGMLRYRTLPP